MTDGIIQEVFKSWEMECIHGNKNTIGYLTHDQIRKREKAIMQELIERIKEQFDVKDSDIRIIVRQLIGDSA